MSQVHWIYEDQGSRRHEVSIYHGDRSGHVLIYCNTSIVKIDFGVFDSRKYSFMIDEELFQIALVKNSHHKFEYLLSNVNQSEVLPVCRMVENYEQKAKTIIFFSLALITVLLTAILFFFV